MTRRRAHERRATLWSSCSPRSCRRRRCSASATRSPTAIAAGLRDARLPRRDGAPSTAVRDAAPARGRDHRTCARVAPDAESSRQADAGQGRARRGGQAVAGAAKKLAGSAAASRDARRSTPRRRRSHLRRIRRQGRLRLPAQRSPRAQPLARGLQEALDEALAQAADPEGDELRGRRRLLQRRRSSSAPRTGCSRCTAPTSCRRRRSASTAGRITGGHRFLARGDIDDRHRRRLRADARSRRQGDRRRSPRAARRSSPACAAPPRGATVDHARRAARRGDGAGRMAGRLRRHVRPRVPRRAAGVPDPDDAAEPEVLRARRRATASSSHRFLARQQLETRDPSAIVAGQRARAARAARRRATSSSTRTARRRLDARVPKLASVVYHNKLGTQLERVDAARAFSRAASRRMIGADPRAGRPRRACSPRPISSPTWSASFPSCRALMGRYYAQHDGEPPAVADAIEQHYWPRFAGDALPRRRRSRRAVALADKLEALAGMFGIGAGADRRQGSVRAAPRTRSASLRILVEKQLARCRSPTLIGARVRRRSTACRRQADARDRARASSTSACAATCATQGYSANQVEAVLAQRPGAHRPRARAARGRAGVRGAARGRRARRRQQAHRQHPAQDRRAKRRTPSTARGSPTAPSTTSIAAFQKLTPHRRRPLRDAAISPARCSRSRAPSPPSTASSTT